MGEENQPIIIKKGKKGGGGHHGGAWKVAYADFVTAMMALFIVLWILSSSEEVKEKVAGYFQDPFGYTTGGGRSVIEGFGTGSRRTVKQKLTDEELREQEQNRLYKMGKELTNQLAESKEFKGIIDQVMIEIIDEGIRFEIMDNSENNFFEIGSSKLKPKAYDLLKKIGAELAKLNNKISIEGHTDARPYPPNAKGYTNWELSTDRANAARKALIAGGIPAKGRIVEVRGYADNHLRNKENPYDLVNRRISIIVKYTDNN